MWNLRLYQQSFSFTLKFSALNCTFFSVFLLVYSQCKKYAMLFSYICIIFLSYSLLYWTLSGYFMHVWHCRLFVDSLPELCRYYNGCISSILSKHMFKYSNFIRNVFKFWEVVRLRSRNIFSKVRIALERLNSVTDDMYCQVVFFPLELAGFI